MCEPAAAPSVEPMSTPFIRIALAAGVAGSLVAAPPALARSAVFGGSTSNDQAIVLRADAKAKKLESAVVAWTAGCAGDLDWVDSQDFTAEAAEPGFEGTPGALVLTRNRRGRFSGRAQYGGSSRGMELSIVVRVSGRMNAKRASGTLDGAVTVSSGGQVQDSCDSGSVRWSAARDPGRIFGGRTSQDEPVVMRLDRARRKVADLMIGWGSEGCEPPGYFNFGEFFTGFPIKNGRFGEAFSDDYDLSDGSKRTFAYDIAGKVGRSEALGSFRATIKQIDGAGTQTLSCDSGAIDWRALTG